MLEEQIIQAVKELAAIPHFPSETVPRAAVMRSLGQFHKLTPERLAKLIQAALDTMTEWEGIAGLRNLYSRLRAAEIEEQHHRQQMLEREKWKLEAALPAGEQDPLQTQCLQVFEQKRLDRQREPVGQKVNAGGNV
jgi:hypothetical protein